MFLMLFADDIVLFTTDPHSLQTQLDKIYTYSSRWSLKINTKKTKVCIFEKRKQVNRFEWVINGDKLEKVDSFCYLGILFHHTGNLKHAIKALSDQALNAYSNLLKIFYKVSMDVKTKFSLFDSLILPILLYGSEVWGIYDFKELDKLHIKFCKQVLGVKQQLQILQY